MIANTTLMWVGTVALVSTFGGLLVSVPRYREGESSLIGIIAYGMSMLFWFLFTLHSTSYMRSLGSGISQDVSTPSFLVVGIIGALLCLVLLFDAALRAIRSNA